MIIKLAYSLALDNRPKEAFEHLSKIKTESVIDDPTKVCLLASRGLAMFRSGFHDQGRQLYLQSIEGTKTIKNQFVIDDQGKQVLRVPKKRLMETVQNIVKARVQPPVGEAKSKTVTKKNVKMRIIKPDLAGDTLWKVG